MLQALPRLCMLVRLFTVSCALLSLSGCQSAYYSTMEKFGIEKRDILVDRVDDARDAQQAATEQFESALSEFMALTQFSGGELQDKYETLKKEFERSEDRANTVRERVSKVESVGNALFREWQQEIKQYSDPRFRKQSESHLERTQIRYQQLLAAMHRSEKGIDPVLDAFRDRVLFLKHNLNARALAAMQGDVVSVQTDVAALIQDMQASIKEADEFIKTMKSG